mmetsp:Transcript_124174/g.356745  ORF Transcript_124174/g.356745 Transcript_124174/m.356745 type:complete len:244 (+) Transcript_124174:82-813(+)
MCGGTWSSCSGGSKKRGTCWPSARSWATMSVGVGYTSALGVLVSICAASCWVNADPCIPSFAMAAVTNKPPEFSCGPAGPNKALSSKCCVPSFCAARLHAPWMRTKRRSKPSDEVSSTPSLFEASEGAAVLAVDSEDVGLSSVPKRHAFATVAVSNQEKWVTPMASSNSVMRKTVIEPYKLQNTMGCLEAMSCGINWPNASTIKAPGKPVCTRANHKKSGNQFGRSMSGNVVTCEHKNTTKTT